jgi:peptidoglycan/LPS O-acetylase OafA/YrhL
MVLFVCIAVGWWFLSPSQYEALGKSIIATLAFASNVWFWLGAGDYFSPDVDFEPLLHTWSLAVEEQFYLFFPLLLWAIASLKRRLWLVIVWIVVAVSFGLSIWMTQAAPIANFYLVPSRAWELGAGSLLALGAFPLSRHRMVHEVAGWAGLILIVASILLISAQTPFPGLTALPSVLGASLIIYAGTGHSVLTSRLLSWWPFVWVGLISYSLYLWHWPILVAARNLNNNADLSIMAAIICIALAVGLAWLSWRYVERPFRATAGPNSMSGLRIFGFSAAGIVILGFFSAFIVMKNGIIGQFPQARIGIYEGAITRAPMDENCINVESPCVIGAPDLEPIVAIWGDSHSAALLPGYDDWLKANNMSAIAYAKSACPPLLDVQRVDRGPDHDCDGHNATVLASVLETPSIGTVIFFARWALATEGSRAENERGGQAILALSGETSNDISDNAQLVELGLSRLVEALRARDLNVIIISGTPEIGVNVPDTVLWQSSDALGPTRIEINQRNERADQIIDDIAEKYGVRVLSPRDFLCSETCLIQIGGVPLYRDDDHFSAFGARWLVNELMNDITLR